MPVFRRMNKKNNLHPHYMLLQKTMHKITKVHFFLHPFLRIILFPNENGAKLKMISALNKKYMYLVKTQKWQVSKKTSPNTFPGYQLLSE